ncbi:hypothetical protein GCM10009738_45230 [Kitasatospora viridis]
MTQCCPGPASAGTVIPTLNRPWPSVTASAWSWSSKYTSTGSFRSPNPDPDTVTRVVGGPADTDRLAAGGAAAPAGVAPGSTGTSAVPASTSPSGQLTFFDPHCLGPRIAVPHDTK